MKPANEGNSMVGATGFEPATSRPPERLSSPENSGNTGLCAKKQRKDGDGFVRVSGDSAGSNDTIVSQCYPAASTHGGAAFRHLLAALAALLLATPAQARDHDAGLKLGINNRGEEDGDETLIFLNQLDDSLIPYFDFSSHYADYPALTILTPSPSEDW